MKKLIFFSSFLGLTFFSFLFLMMFSLTLYRSSLEEQQARAKQQLAYAALPTIDSSFSVEIITNDGRTEAVRQFFNRYGSPLEPYAEDVVKAADEYGLDFRLIPAIAMQESNLCKRIPQDSHNCWGFGIYGSKITRFSSYSEAIDTVTRTLATKYKAKGLITPDQIVTMYTPSSNGSWAFSVNQFMNELQ